MTGLLEHDQEHLFRSWPPLGTQDDDKRRLLAQLRQLDDNYAGGLIKYITNAKRLLQESKEGEGCLEGCKGGREDDQAHLPCCLYIQNSEVHLPTYPPRRQPI